LIRTGMILPGIQPSTKAAAAPAVSWQDLWPCKPSANRAAQALRRSQSSLGVYHLTVDQQPARDRYCVVLGGHINGGPEDVPLDLGVAADADHILPQLLAMLGAPTVVTLENRNNELVRPSSRLVTWVSSALIVQVQSSFTQGHFKVIGGLPFSFRHRAE
jgi:hypothetical protein